MCSSDLNDVFDKDDVVAWVNRIDKLLPAENHEFFADIKMDGLACALIYIDGIFTQAVTRGDSFVGEDVTNNVRTIKNVPLRLHETKGYEIFLRGRTEIRGAMFCSVLPTHIDKRSLPFLMIIGFFRLLAINLAYALFPVPGTPYRQTLALLLSFTPCIS